MAIGLVALILINVGLTILGRLLTGRTKRPKPAPFETPKAESGKAIPRFFGVQQLQGNVLLVRDKARAERDDGARVYYLARMIIGWGIGPANVLWDMIADERSMLLQRPGGNQSGMHPPRPITNPALPIDLTGDAPTVIEINARQMFGGNSSGDPREGGMQGVMRLYRGTDAQPIDPLTQYGYGEFASAWPGLIYSAFGTDPDVDDGIGNLQGTQFYWVANTPQPKTISMLMGYYPNALLNFASPLGAVVGARGANPAEVLYEVLTDPRYGRGWPTSRFNVPQWQSKARQFKSEGMGVSLTLDGQTLDDFIDDVESHADCKIVRHPLTGLIELRLLRGDYDISSLHVINKDSARDFSRGGKTIAKTINQVVVKYRKFVSGGKNHTLETVTEHLDGFNAVNLFTWQADGRNISNVTATRTRDNVTITLTQDVDYSYHTSNGWFYFAKNSNIQIGDKIQVEYDTDSIFSGFVDDVATDQNPANRLLTGSVRSESYDYPFFTSFLQAKAKAVLLRKLLGRNLDTFKWKENKAGSYTTVGDPVLANEPDWGANNLVIRVTKVNRGKFNSRTIECEGIEDVWGERLTLAALAVDTSTPVVPPGVPIDAIVLISCLGGSTRIGVVATDITYNIEIEASVDAGFTAPITITPAGGIAGSSLYFDYAVTVGETWYFRARLIHPSLPTGPWSAIVSCTASADPPSTPTNTIPTWSIEQSQTDEEGTATLIVTDPQNRVTLVEWKSRVGLAAETDYVPFEVEPYEATVAMDEILDSSITFRITYYSIDNELVTAEAIATFSPNPLVIPPTPASGAQPMMVCIPFHTTLTESAVFEFLPAEVRELHIFGRRRVDATGCARVQGQIQVRQPLPAGAKVGWQYIPAIIEHPNEDDWRWIEKDADGPVVAADGATDIPIVSNIVKMAFEARQEIVLRAVALGGDDATTLEITENMIYLLGQAVGDEFPEGGDPTCQDSSVNFNGYPSLQAAEDDGWTNIPDASAGGSMSLDATGGINGSKAIVISTDVTEFNYTTAQGIQYVFSGLTPGHTYAMTTQIKISPSFLTEADYTFYSLRFFIGPTSNIAAGSARTLSFGGEAEEWVGNFAELSDSDAGPGNAIISQPDGAGNITFGVSITNFLPGHVCTHPNSIWIDNIILMDVTTGEIVGPCLSGEAPPDDEDDGISTPIIPAPATGIRSLGLWNVSAPYTQYPPFYGICKPVSADTILDVLDDLKVLNYRALLTLVGHNDSEVNGTFSYTKTIDSLNKYQGKDISPYLDMLVGFVAGDDIFSTAQWGVSSPIQWSVWEQIGKRITEIFPGIPTFVRASAILLRQHGVTSSKYIKAVINQWTGPGRDGAADINQYMTLNKSACNSLSMRWAWGLNARIAGPNHGFITPETIRRDGIPMARDPESFGFFVWASTPPYSFLRTSDYISAFTDVRNVIPA